MPLDTNFNVDPYYDDFDEAKNFHRVLFRPGVAVQARELTQLQSILQNQIERFGDNIFVQGTIIQGCNFSFDSNYNYIKLPDLRVDGQLTVPSQYVGLRVVSATTSNLQAIVINSQNGLETQNPDLHTLFIKYINSGVNNESTFAADEQLVFYTNTNPSNTTSLSTQLSVKVAPAQLNSINTNPVGVGYAFTVGEGIIFQKGFFVKVEDPITAVISKYSSSPNNVSVGFSTTESIITEYTDSSLLDNASGYTNANAPGANRLKLTPTLVVANTDLITSNNTMSLVDWQYGNPIRINQDTQYNVINKELARREYETNGDFVINPFKLVVEDRPGTNNISAVVSSGLGYIAGNRVDLKNSSRYSVRRAVDTQTLSNQTVAVSYGNYIVVQDVAGYFSIGSSVTLYDTATSAVTKEGYQSISPLGSVIGTAQVLSFIYASGTVDTPTAQYYLYLTNITMNSGKAFTSVKGAASATGVVDFVLTYNLSTNSNIAVLTDSNFSKTIFPTGKSFVKTLNPNANVITSFVYRKNDTINVNSNGVSSSVTLSGNQQFYYGVGTLTSIVEQAVIVVPTSNIYITNATGTVTTTNGSPNVVGTSTTFTFTYQENDYINVGNSTVRTIKQIKNIANDTLIIVSNNIVNAYTSNTHSKVYPKNIPINFANRNSSITVANTTSMYFTLKNSSNVTETLQAAANVSIYYDVKSTNSRAVQKTLNRNRVVCIDTALFAPFAANITCNTTSNIINTTNTVTNNYISTGYNIYLSGTNANSALLGTVSSVNSTAITLVANAASNCFTFLAFGGTATCNTTSTIINTTNTAVNTYISNGYNIYLASNNAYLGTAASVNTTAITLATNAALNITSNNITFSSAINKLTYSANNSTGPSGPWPLGFPDVYRIGSVYRQSVGNTFTTNSNYLATSMFELQVNQTDTTYGISNLILSNNARGASPIGNGDKLTVLFDVFTIPSSSSPGLFSIDSYPVDANTANGSAIQLQNVPVYTTSTGSNIRLRDYIDFRAYTANTIDLAATANLATASANAVVINPTTNTTFISSGFITPGQSFNYDVSYYLGRVDKVIMNSGGNVNVIEGLPSENPQAPAVKPSGMTLGNINIPPYPSLVLSQVNPTIADPTIVTVSSAKQNRRFTMRDIGSINNRVSSLEYYSALSILEKNTSGLLIKNSLGQDRFKNGIFVDTFENLSGSSIVDSEYFISMDSRESSLIPRFEQVKIDLVYNSNENSNTVLHSHRKTGDLVTLNYTETSYLNQSSATRVRNCSEGYYSWSGTLYTSPLYDSYIDIRVAPNPSVTTPAPAANVVITTNTVSNTDTTIITVANTSATANTPYPPYPSRGALLGVPYCVGTDQYQNYADGSGGSYQWILQGSSTACGWVPPTPVNPYPLAGTILSTNCVSYDKYQYIADGSGGNTASLVISNTPECGYIPPTVPTITWPSQPVSSCITINTGAFGDSAIYSFCIDPIVIDILGSDPSTIATGPISQRERDGPDDTIGYSGSDHINYAGGGGPSYKFGFDNQV